ncbi:hypothetical protein Ccrd_024876, partial [Cynara cardunculus var. scolymus]
MPSIWAREEGDRIPILFNEYGQPVDKETTDNLSHFMGSLARSGKYCPVDILWHQVSTTKKGILLNFIEKISERNKNSRGYKKMMQITGKISYARVREELKEQMLDLNFQLPEGSLDEQGSNDVFLKVMGKDKHCSARMYGLGVRGSDIWGVLPSRSAYYRENMLWKRAYKDVSNEVVELKAMVGDVVHLKSIINSMKIVARGRVKSLDPDELVGGKEIGPNWCE